MMRRRSILGALAVCALSLCAFAAASASAAELTAVTCEGVTAGTGKYQTSACETPKVEASNFETKALPVGTTTEVTGSGVGKAVLKGFIAFVNVEVTCEETSITGHVTNVELSAGKHTIEGRKILIDYKKCHASLQSDTTKKCEVESITGTPNVKGTIATNELRSNVTSEHNIEFRPVVSAAEIFAEFKILKTGECPIPTTTAKVTGAVLGVANTTKHSHVTFDPFTNGGLLRVNGGAASYEGTNTAVMKGTSNVVGAQTFTPEG